MKYQTITVGIHEKRNHPTEFGHFDANVSYTVQVEDGEDIHRATEFLRKKAREYVEAELDARIAQVNLENERREARSSLRWIVGRASHDSYEEQDAQAFETHLLTLPSDEQTDWRAKLGKAKETYLAAMRERLDEYIEKATRNKLSSYNIDYFNEQVEFMPESEQDTYRKQMEAALERAESVAKAEEIPY